MTTLVVWSNSAPVGSYGHNRSQLWRECSRECDVELPLPVHRLAGLKLAGTPVGKPAADRDRQKH